jgi:hypothetical protein
VLGPKARTRRLEQVAEHLQRIQRRIVRARYFAWKRRLAQLFAAGYDLDRLPSCLPRVEGSAE